MSKSSPRRDSNRFSPYSHESRTLSKLAKNPTANIYTERVYPKGDAVAAGLSNDQLRKLDESVGTSEQNRDELIGPKSRRWLTSGEARPIKDMPDKPLIDQYGRKYVIHQETPQHITLSFVLPLHQHKLSMYATKTPSSFPPLLGDKLELTDPHTKIIKKFSVFHPASMTTDRRGLVTVVPM